MKAGIIPVKKYKVSKQNDEVYHVQMLKQSKCYDSLTGLPKINYLKNLFFNNENYKYCQGTLLIIEIYDFNIIKNIYGYDIGDEILKKTGHLLDENITGSTVICRGTENRFIVFIPYLISLDCVKLLYTHIFHIFEKPVFVRGRTVYLNINIGSALYPHGCKNLLQILKNADLALYKSKKQGINTAVFYYEGLQEEISRRLEIYNNLRSAVHKNELEVYYQPQVDTKSNEILKFEALLRWNNEELGNISPIEFIPISEETGIIIELGEWILKEVCKQIKRWMGKGYYHVISLNVSQKQIQSESFVDKLINIVKEFDIPINLIEIEITESVLMSSYEANVKTIRLIQSMGVKIALDDFGTGYSSLSYLRTLPIDIIKIDKSFVDDIVSDKVSRAIISGIIALVKKLQLNVTAEGVESKEQVDLLKNMGCSMIQGYYYSKPAPAMVIENNYLRC